MQKTLWALQQDSYDIKKLYHKILYTMSNFRIQVQGLSSTKILVGGVGGGVGQGLEKLSATMVGRRRKFKVLICLKPLDWLLIFFAFSGTFLNMSRTFLVCQNNFCKPFSFYKGFFIEVQKYFCLKWKHLDLT